MVGVLMMVYVFSFIDRQILNLLVGPIRADLQISDTQMSLLLGFSFAVFYTFCGIPLGRLADSRSRRGLIAFGLVFWSGATAACGMVGKYWQLFLARVGVGIGEAALSPAAYSLITDYFPRDRRATAMSVYSMGIFLGTGIAFLLGGLVVGFALKHGPVMLPVIGEIRPWQVVFLILGCAGVLFSVVLLTVREPPRGAMHAQAPLREVLAYMRLNLRTVLCHNFGFALLALSSYSASAWLPSYFIRVHGWNAGQFGLVYGTLVAIFACSGIIFGGWLADRWLKQGRVDATLRVGYIAALGLVPLGSLFVFAADAQLAAALLVPGIFLLAMPFGVAPAGLQEIMPPNMRGQATAVYLFIVNLIGLGIGPTAVALFTDYVFGNDLAVGWSIFVVCVTAQFMAAVLLRDGLAPFRESLARRGA
ncbi:MAG TPA: MFS transporter [Verrucomicrobiae bacterium]|nr:MFS transporter [Verrucomicrobiae bacterium]